jgi:hypothetical protein
MGLSSWFENFNKAILIESSKVSTISLRYKAITKKLNESFWGHSSETLNSLYVGSYGRGTEIHVSDIDMLFDLPWSYYSTYDNYITNGQSAFLQAVKKALDGLGYYPQLGADGQVVVIESWYDNIRFELLPCFENLDNSYTYADTNGGGSWKKTNPRPEIAELTSTNHSCNRNLKRLCRMTRAWKDKWSVPMSGILIDTLAYNFIRTYEYREKSHYYYDWLCRDFFKFLSEQDASKSYWLSPGAKQYVYRTGNFEYKAKQCYNIAVEAIAQESNSFNATYEWRKIYGDKFPLEL